jgi:hypothetical protein
LFAQAILQKSNITDWKNLVVKEADFTKADSTDPTTDTVKKAVIKVTFKGDVDADAPKLDDGKKDISSTSSAKGAFPLASKVQVTGVSKTDKKNLAVNLDVTMSEALPTLDAAKTLALAQEIFGETGPLKSADWKVEQIAEAKLEAEPTTTTDGSVAMEITFSATPTAPAAATTGAWKKIFDDAWKDYCKPNLITIGTFTLPSGDVKVVTIPATVKFETGDQAQCTLANLKKVTLDKYVPPAGIKPDGTTIQSGKVADEDIPKGPAPEEHGWCSNISNTMKVVYVVGGLGLCAGGVFAYTKCKPDSQPTPTGTEQSGSGTEGTPETPDANAAAGSGTAGEAGKPDGQTPEAAGTPADPSNNTGSWIWVLLVIVVVAVLAYCYMNTGGEEEEEEEEGEDGDEEEKVEAEEEQAAEQ